MLLANGNEQSQRFFFYVYKWNTFLTSNFVAD